MRTGERGFGPALQTDTTDFEDWRATYRWPFIALCLVLSLGVIASGGSRADAEQQVEIRQSVPPIVELQSSDSSAARIGINSAAISSVSYVGADATIDSKRVQIPRKPGDSGTTHAPLQTTFNTAQPIH